MLPRAWAVDNGEEEFNGYRVTSGEDKISRWMVVSVIILYAAQLYLKIVKMENFVLYRFYH